MRSISLSNMSRTLVRRRRARAVLAASALTLMLIGPVSRAVAHRAQPTGHRRVYVVRSGDTVWSIATRFAHGDDPRPVVDSIVGRNGIDAGMIFPGQPLVIPPIG